MRALVIAPQPFFSPRGTPFSVYYRTCITAQLGVNVDLLTYGEGEDVEIPGVRIIRIPRFGFLGQVKVGPSLLKLFLDQFMILWTIALLLRRRYDFVHAHEESVFWCRFLKPIFRFRLVYDMHSSLPQQLTNFRFTTSRLLIGLFERLERTCVKAADALVTICPDLQDYALGTGIDPKKHLLIENCIFDDVRVKDVSTNGHNGNGVSITAPLRSRTGPLVVYAGTFEPYQGLEILIRSFRKVVSRRPDAHLLLVGGAPQQVRQLKTLADSVGLNGCCTFTGRVSKSEAATLSKCADVLVSPRRDGTNTPLKLYEQLASGKPLVATRIRSHTQVLDDQICFLVDPEPASMAQGILDAIEDTSRRDQIVKRAKSLFESQYSRAAYESKMQQLLELVR